VAVKSIEQLGENHMAQKKTVKFTGTHIEGGEINVAGRGVNKGQMGLQGEAADSVLVELSNIKNANINVAGTDVTLFNAIAAPLDELVGLLVEALNDRGDKQYVQEVASGLLDEAQKPVPEKNQSKIKQLLNSLGSYIGLATLAATQAENAQQLFEKVQHLLTGG